MARLTFAVENYFNYFTEIEERFQKRRGSLQILSTLDWSLIETWKDAGIPLEAVLSGIDATFDKHDRRPTKTRKINSLAYCTQEVMGAVEDMKEAAVGSTRERETEVVATDALTAFFTRNAAALEKARLPESISPLIAENARVLRELAEGFAAQPPSLEDLERRMTIMEEKLLAALQTSSTDDDLVAIRAQADRELAPYRGKMSAPQIDQLLKQYTNKKLLERYNLPRLSLFYM